MCRMRFTATPSGAWARVGMIASLNFNRAWSRAAARRARRVPLANMVSAEKRNRQAQKRRARNVQVGYAFDLALAFADAEASDRRLILAQETLTLAQEDARIASALSCGW